MTLRSHLIIGSFGVVDRIDLLKVTILGVFFIMMSQANCFAQSKSQAMIIDLLLGEPVPFDQALDDMAKTRIIYLGEHHTIARHHKLQLDVIRGLAQRGLSLSVGLEMFSTEQQATLDEWSNSQRDIGELARRLGPERWTNLQDYAEILKFAREIKAPILGLNAADALVRKVAREGLDSLSDIERQSIPSDVGDINPQYERLLRLKLRVHKSFQDKKLEKIILAQAVRDSVMSGTIVDFLSSTAGAGKCIVVIAGSGHLNYGFGIPERVERRINLAHRIMLPSESGELVLSEQELRHAAPIEITHEDLDFIKTRIASYLSVLPLPEEDKHLETEMLQARIK